MTARTLAALRPGDSAAWTHEVTEEDIDAFVELSGDANPLHVDDAFARRHGFRGRVVHGMLLSAYVSRLLGLDLPGPGALWLAQTTRFASAVYVGDRIEVRAQVKHRSDSLRTVVLDVTVVNQRGEVVLSGEAKMMMLHANQAPPWEETVAIVTGGSRGIGAEVSRALGRRGTRVIVGCHASRDAAEVVVEAIKDSGGEARAVAADLSQPRGADALAAAALEAYGRVDLVIHSATAPIERKSFEETTIEELDAHLGLYVRAALILAQAVVPGMKERGYGRFVHVLTSAVWGAPPEHTGAYVAAKSGLLGLARAMAVDLAPHGIAVNMVSPSAVVTDQWAGEPDSRLRAIAQRIPMRRLAGSEEVAAAVLFLAGDGGTYITGANIPVAGGEVM